MDDTNEVLIDSGASIDCMVKQFSSTLNQRTQNCVCIKHTSDIIEKMKVNIRKLENSQPELITFLIIDSKGQSLIGNECATNVGVLKIQVNTKQESEQTTLNDYADRFEGVGTLKTFDVFTFLKLKNYHLK